MTDLVDILNSGDLIALKLKDINNPTQDFNINPSDGISLPSIPASDAAPNSIFFNTDNARVCWKSPGGLVFRFRMELVP